MFVFNTLAPVFLLIALGAALLKVGVLTPELSKGVNRIAYWVALPALLFQSTASATFSGGLGGPVLTLVFASVAVTAIALGVALALRLQPVPAGTFVHVAMRGNVTFVGVAVIFYVIDATGGNRTAELKSAAILIGAPYILLQNVLGIAALLAGQRQPGGRLVRTVFREVATHPILLAVALGLVVAWAGWRIPLAIDRSLHALGAIALPAALLGIGASLMTVRIRGQRRPAILASLLKLAVMPALGVLSGQWLDVGREAMMMVLIYLSCPTGASSFTVVGEMGGDEAMASTTIVLSTLLSAVPLAVIVAWY